MHGGITPSIDIYYEAEIWHGISPPYVVFRKYFDLVWRWFSGKNK